MREKLEFPGMLDVKPKVALCPVACFTTIMVPELLVTLKVAGAEVPPPGVGLVTVTERVPIVVNCVDGILALIWPVELNVVVYAVPLKLIIAPTAKPVPVTVKGERLPVLTIFEEGINEDIEGMALLTVRDLVLEVPPPGVGLTTDTEYVPPLSRSACEEGTSREVLETNAGVMANPLI